MNRSRGFSLIEVLVSIVILSVALLGTAGLVATSMRNTNTSYYRSQATVLANDLLDRMRANVTAARNHEYDLDFGPTCPGGAGQMAAYDCAEWTTTVKQTLPSGNAKVTVDANFVATVIVEWDNGDNSFTTKSRL
jgi:type IV pilus assembly protein PilV